MKAAPFLFAALLTGCQSVAVVDHGHTTVQTTGVRVHLTSGDRVLAGVLVAMVVADAVQYYVRGDDGTMTRIERLPEPEPSRRVNAQDCTRPVDPERGNLLCR